MANQPTISIVTPSYNQGNYLEATIRSVIEQDVDGLEYIIVDGGSTDNTVDILKQYSEHPRIARIISEPDNGQTDALIKGFSLCTGSILGWLNSDDLFNPDALKKVCSTFQAHPEADVVSGTLRFINSRAERLGMAHRKEMKREDWLRTTMSIGQQCTFYRTAAYHSIGGLDPSIHNVMDYDLFMRMALNGARFHYIPDTLASFRLHDVSKTIGTPWRLWKEEFIVFRRHGGRPFSAFYYWKGREILSYFIKRKLLKIRKY